MAWGGAIILKEKSYYTSNFEFSFYLVLLLTQRHCSEEQFRLTVPVHIGYGTGEEKKKIYRLPLKYFEGVKRKCERQITHLECMYLVILFKEKKKRKGLWN